MAKPNPRTLLWVFGGFVIIMAIIIAVVVSAVVNAGTSALEVSGATCARPCVEGEPPRVCHYEFTLELYQTLSRACFDCPKNQSHCYKDHCVPGNGYQRGIMSTNRQVPGPAIEVCENDIIVVNVNNRIHGEGVTIHWHGIHQKGTQYMDGVPMVTQCPFPQYTSFQYRFRASPAGTHFWHSHAGFQRSDGLFGVLVAHQSPERDPNSALYDHDLPEHVIMLSDLMHQFSITKFAGRHHAGKDDFPDSLLINGKGRWKDPVTGDTTKTPYEMFLVEDGKKYRIRLINGGSFDCPLHFSIDNHNITLIATDGVPVKPEEVRSLFIFSGERYDFILTADQPVDAYWIRTNGYTDCEAKGAKQEAVLKYEGSTLNEPTTEVPSYTQDVPAGKLLNPVSEKCDAPDRVCVTEVEAQQRINPALATYDVDFKLFLPFDFRLISNENFYHSNFYPYYTIQDEMQIVTPQVNNISFLFPPAPLLTQKSEVPDHLVCDATSRSSHCDSQEEYCECVHMIDVPLGASVEIILVDEGRGGEESHPFHLHGYNFYVVGMDWFGDQKDIESVLDEVKSLNNMGKLARNLKDPILKDTVGVPNRGYTIIRFVADNPGYWFFHCHLIFHSEIGMGVVLHVGDDEILPTVPKHFPTCGNWALVDEEANKI